MPLPSLLQLIDVILAIKIDAHLNALYPNVDSYMECARPETQPMDVVFTVHMAFEKGMDHESQSAVASADIARFFDS